MAPSSPVVLSAVEVPALVKRVFIDQGGMFYAAAEKLSEHDAESNFPTQDMRDVLDETPVYREVMIDRIIKLGNKRTNAVLGHPNPVDDLAV